MDTALQMMDDGGPMMWVLFGISVVGLLVALERGFDLYFLRRLRTAKFLQVTLGYVRDRQFSKALAACNVKTRHPVVGVIRAGVLRANRREKEIERAMEKEMLEALPHVQKRISFVALLANLATLLGLLGTIAGLMKAFDAVASASAAERQTALASGIAEAMYTTAFGIMIAVLLLFLHHMVNRRAEQILMDTEGGASATLVALTGAVEDPASSRSAAA